MPVDTEANFLMRLVFAIIGIAIGLDAKEPSPAVPVLLVLALVVLLYRENPYKKEKKS
jgi:hypothetical protein